MDVHDGKTIGPAAGTGPANAVGTDGGGAAPADAAAAAADEAGAAAGGRGGLSAGAGADGASAPADGGDLRASIGAAGRIERTRTAVLALTFARAALVYWGSVFPRVSVQIARWRRRARRIPDPTLRELALQALEKRGNIEGAAAFAAFAARPCRRQATAAASAFQCAYNLLDLLGEQPSADPVRDGHRLHEALVFAIAGDAPRQDWYEFHPQRDDGGFLQSLLEECRTAFAQLPSAETVAPWARAAAERIVAFQSLNLSEAQGDHSGLEGWATAATPTGSDLRWWETAAAAGSSLSVHTLIAAAAQAGLGEGEARAIAEAYFPWIGCLHSLLDNLIDKREDEAAGHRSLLEYYQPLQAAERLRLLTFRAAECAENLPTARAHQVMLAAMVANYLSSDETRAPELRPIGEAVLSAAGPLTRPAMLVFKLRRLG